MHRRLSGLFDILAVAAPLTLLTGPANAAPASAPAPEPTSAKPYDVDGDGYPELVVGAPGLSGPLLVGSSVAGQPLVGVLQPGLRA